MQNLLLLLCAALIAVQTICFTYFSKTFRKNTSSFFAYSFLLCSVMTVIFVLTHRGEFLFSPLTLLLAVLFGSFYMLTIALYMKTLELGPVSLSSLLYSLNLLIPILYGIIFLSEQVTALKVAGLAMILVTFALTSLGEKEGEGGRGRINGRWLAFSIGALLTNGALGILQKAHQGALPGKEINEFLTLSFITASILSLLLLFTTLVRQKHSLHHLKAPGFAGIVVIAGAAAACVNILILGLASRVPGMVLFPVVNGGAVILSSMTAALLLKEKLAFRGRLGLLTGLVSIVLLSI